MVTRSVTGLWLWGQPQVCGHGVSHRSVVTRSATGLWLWGQPQVCGYGWPSLGVHHLGVKLAYRKDHSTETAVLSVLDGLLTKADEKLVSLVTLLDLSAAFDTLDHSVLLHRLETTFGIHSVALSWFKSYLTGRSQSVIIDSKVFSPSPLACGVPQGSVLGPVLFTLYSQPLSDVISSHGCVFHKYADDT